MLEEEVVMQDYILKNGRIIDPVRKLDRKMDIGISGGIIVEPSETKSPIVINLDEKLVSPGFIDMHVHLRDPGHKNKETVASGTAAAAAGGFTEIVAMPNTNPPADTQATIELLRRKARDKGVVRVLPCGAMTKGLEGSDMASIGGLKKAGVIALSDDGNCIQNHEIMRHVVQYAKSFELPILDHAQDKSLSMKGNMHEGYWSTVLGISGIPSQAEELMISRDIILSKMLDWKIHIQHLSTKSSVEHIRNAKSEGVKISGELTPHHISLTDEKIKTFNANYKMNPPLRSEEDRQALIEGLKDGTIEAIATDHAPHTETEKLVEFDYAPFGIIGLETAVGVCLTELYHKNFLDMNALIEKFTVGPRNILGIEQKSLENGEKADITIIDIEKEYIVKPSKFKSKSRNTPFKNWKLKGKPIGTFVGGKLVFQENLVK